MRSDVNSAARPIVGAPHPPEFALAANFQQSFFSFWLAQKRWIDWIDWCVRGVDLSRLQYLGLGALFRRLWRTPLRKATGVPQQSSATGSSAALFLQPHIRQFDADSRDVRLQRGQAQSSQTFFTFVNASTKRQGNALTLLDPPPMVGKRPRRLNFNPRGM
jgi:hypothetical protein